MARLDAIANCAFRLFSKYCADSSLAAVAAAGLTKASSYGSAPAFSRCAFQCFSSLDTVACRGVPLYASSKRKALRSPAQRILGQRPAQRCRHAGTTNSTFWLILQGVTTVLYPLSVVKTQQMALSDAPRGLRVSPPTGHLECQGAVPDVIELAAAVTFPKP